jgi:adenylate cyclase
LSGEAEAARRALARLSVPVAIADGETGAILYENGAFFELFRRPTVEGDNIREHLQQVDWPKAERRLESGRAYRIELELGGDVRKSQQQIELRSIEEGGDTYIIVEGRDIGKQREAEYMLDSYARMAEKNAKELQREKERVEKLLLNLMPRSVYEELRDYGTTTPERYDDSSVLMLDFVNFTEMTVAREPGELVSELNDIFSAFDRIVELCQCERIKTIGDAYIAVSGVPDKSDSHAINLARVAVRMKRFLERRNAAHSNCWSARMGLASGTLIGSMIGIQKYVYDIFGPAVNLAARMEQLADPMQIVMSESFRSALDESFAVARLDEVDIKGFGRQSVYSLEFEKK